MLQIIIQRIIPHIGINQLQQSPTEVPIVVETVVDGSHKGSNQSFMITECRFIFVNVPRDILLIFDDVAPILKSGRLGVFPSIFPDLLRQLFPDVRGFCLAIPPSCTAPVAFFPHVLVLERVDHLLVGDELVLDGVVQVDVEHGGSDDGGAFHDASLECSG
eukprot:CAMPEP_0197241928 /NCGR_PEP_ID=MMETSP1429-20130617/7820_1 /TAXON_ID=49237 /ORGANISM="Chaetoceros  sp., Strain UNC1202" /LENGTH=160 /DNA_ID=CAMNT_0042701845 /DNA_START=586 /DNA_END=1068 /DNA_ORIENTATION=-